MINLLKFFLVFKNLVFKYIYTKLVKIKVKKFGNDLSVNNYSAVSRNTIVGNNVNFNGMKIKGKAKVSFGDNFHSGEECLIITDIHNYDNGNKIPYDETYIMRDVVIEDNVWFGDRIIVLGGVTIGEGSIIQAGSVIVKDIPKYSIAGGHPAKVFKTRDIIHYERLKSEGKFH